MEETTLYPIPIQMNHDTRKTIRPSHSMYEIFGDCVYCPKLYAKDYDHFSSDFASLEALTGRELGILGEIPVICHAATATEPALALIKKAGLKIPPVLYTYSSDEEYVQLLKDLEVQKKQIIFQYPQPLEDVSPHLFWVDPQVVAFLSDKRNIPQLVPAEHVPKRRMMSLEDLIVEKPTFPIVLKTGDGRPTSGGNGVKLIMEQQQLESINETFGDLSTIIVEEYIHNHKNISVHYFVNRQGEIQFLGKSEQLVNEDGCYRSSWISREVEDELNDVIRAGFQVMENLHTRGYYGIAGFDVLIQQDRFYFIDLNIRFNASTCGLLLFESILEQHDGKNVVRLCNFEWSNPFSEALPLVESFMNDGHFIPLCLLDSDYLSVKNQLSKVVGLVIGHSAGEVENVIEKMEETGLRQKE